MQNPDEVNTSPTPRKKGKKLSVINEEFDLSLFILIAQKKMEMDCCCFPSFTYHHCFISQVCNKGI